MAPKVMHVDCLCLMRGHGSREDYYSDGKSLSPISRSQSRSPRRPRRSPRAADVGSPRRSPSPKENGRSPIRRHMQAQATSS